MSEVFQKLIQMVPPPSFPHHAPSNHDFDKVESKICLSFPEDYKELLKTYGHGTWQGFWYIFNPGHHELETWCSPEDDDVGHSHLAIKRAARKEDLQYDPESEQYPIFPEEGGLLPWAFTDNGGVFFWLTKGGRSKWPTVYYDESLWRATEPTVIELTCTEIVFGAVSGELPIFAEEFGSDYEYGLAHEFDPAT